MTHLARFQNSSSERTNPADTHEHKEILSSLISVSEKVSSFSTKLPSYESLFPRPSVISSSPPTKYTDDDANGKNCKCCNIDYCSTYSARYTPYKRRVTIPQGFELPTVDDHFRKSLGEKYDTSKRIDERPSSVDEHFVKALGTNWYNYTS